MPVWKPKAITWKDWLWVLASIPVIAWIGGRFEGAQRTEADSKAAAAKTAAEQKRDDDFAETIRRQVYCQKSIRRNAKYPSKASFDPGFLTQPRVVRNGDVWIVTGTVEMMNSFGAMLPHTYRCRFEDNTLVQADVAPN